MTDLPEGVGEPASRRFHPEALQGIADAIAEAGGREVFFAGRLDAQGLVTRVEVHARGHERAVPALLDRLPARAVVIHNHPSGNLSPSDADLQLAAVYGHNGHGVYIVDNQAHRVFVVVEPFLDATRKPVDIDLLTGAFQPGGRMAKVVPHFEVRPQQAAMMAEVAQAFNDDGIAVIEAPTGVGKTMAYLVPALEWAQKNGERVVVSTRTINLQEQICFKDVPMLEKLFDRPFKAVLVKGRSNYLCPRKLQRARSEASLFADAGEEQELAAVAEWAERTSDGSLSDLSFVPRREVWEKVCSESDTCSLAQCPSPNRCFVGRARREVAKADILVVNHHMFFSDMAIKREQGVFSASAVLPSFRRVIFDEAHNIEDSATEYLGMQVTRNGALTALGRLLRMDRGPERGLLPYLKAKLMREQPGSMASIESLLDYIDRHLYPAVAACREALNDTFGAIRAYVAGRSRDVGRDIRWRLTPAVLEEPDLRALHRERVVPCTEILDGVAAMGRTLFERLAELPGIENKDADWSGEFLQLQAYTQRLVRLAAGLSEGTADTLKPNTVRWIEIDSRDKNVVRVARSPLEVGEPLAEWLYANLKTIVMTSATLTVQQRFDYFHNRVGLDKIEARPVKGQALDSPFNFHEQALLCVPTDIAGPEESGFLDDVVAHTGRILAITKGHAFVLFTSFYALDYAHRHLEHALRKRGITPLRQGEASRTRLLDRFRDDPSSVLFATESFWEGVDVAGDALQCVILAKLPFRVPTEPIQEARAEAIDATNGNAFMDYVVPQAVIKFRQGFGRLIRRRTDRGAVVVLDRRVVQKRYGRVFLQSLPAMTVARGPSDEIYQTLDQFFSRKGTAS